MLRRVFVDLRWGPALIERNGAAMKGYSEQHGVLSQIIYDAHTGQFVQRVCTHAFANLSASAVVIELTTHKSNSADTILSRKVRKTVMQPVQNKRTG